MINWIYRGCNTDQGEINNVTINLAKADFNENEEWTDIETYESKLGIWGAVAAEKESENKILLDNGGFDWIMTCAKKSWSVYSRSIVIIHELRMRKS